MTIAALFGAAGRHPAIAESTECCWHVAITYAARIPSQTIDVRCPSTSYRMVSAARTRLEKCISVNRSCPLLLALTHKTQESRFPGIEHRRNEGASRRTNRFLISDPWLFLGQTQAQVRRHQGPATLGRCRTPTEYLSWLFASRVPVPVSAPRFPSQIDR